MYVCVGGIFASLQRPLPVLLRSPAVSLLSGIGSLINFISVCGGEQLLPVCAGEDGENVLVSPFYCKWNKNESDRSQTCPKVSEKRIRTDLAAGAGTTRRGDEPEKHRPDLFVEQQEPWKTAGGLVQRQAPFRRGGVLSQRQPGEQCKTKNGSN